MIDTVIVLAKRPSAGRVKTRLTPPLSPDQAARVAAAALADTLAVADRIPARRRLLAFDGPTDGWMPAGWWSVRQGDGGLDVRLADAFEAAGAGSAVLVGMDTPQLRPDQILSWDPDRYDACLGPANDGGFWALGLRDVTNARAAVTGVPMSTPETGAAQLRRLHALGHRVQLLDELVDVDTICDAVLVAEQLPGSRFGRTLAALRPDLPAPHAFVG